MGGTFSWIDFHLKMDRTGLCRHAFNFGIAVGGVPTGKSQTTSLFPFLGKKGTSELRLISTHFIFTKSSG